MEHKRVNLGFLTFLILESILLLSYDLWAPLVDLDSTMISTLVAESTLFLPPVIFLWLGRKEYSLVDRIGLRPMKLSTTVIVFIYGVVIMPIGTLANAISMLWVDNTVMESGSDMLADKWYLALIASAVIAPFIEELCFRGFMYNGYRRDGARMSAVVLSSLCFAFMHMNFNQAAYAFVLGIAFALIYEATGSMWSTFICHALFNAETVILMFVGDYLYPGIYDDITVDRAEIMSEIPVYVLISVIAIVLAAFLLFAAGKLAGRSENLRELFSRFESYEKKPKIVTAPLVVALSLLFTYMVAEEVLKYIYS